jgi:hypothetical protein
MTNASMARQVVFELFQDLDRFNLGDYKKYDDEGRGMRRLVAFAARAVRLAGQEFVQIDATKWMLRQEGRSPIEFTSDRDRALEEEKLELLGLEHPIIHTHLQKFLDLDTPDRSVFGVIEGIPGSGTLMVWKINTQAKDGQANHHIVRIGMTKDGDRAPWLEKLGDKILGMADSGSMPADYWKEIVTRHKQKVQELLHRELLYSGIISEEMSYSATLLAVFGIEN